MGFMIVNSLERERPLVDLKLSDVARKYMPTFFTVDSFNLKDHDSRINLWAGEFREAFGLALIVGSMLLGGSQSSEITIPLTALAGIMFYGTGKYDSRRAIKRDFQLQEIERERAAREALSGWKWNDWGKWFNDFFKVDWPEKFPGASKYYEKYQPQNFSAEFRMSGENDGRKTLYIRDGFNSVAADDCYCRSTQVKRLQEEKLVSEKAKKGKVWTIYAANIDYLGWEERGEEKMVDLIKTTTDAINTVYQGELVYAFAGTNDKKLQVILEKSGFVKRGETAEWPSDLDKKAFFVLDLREKGRL